jgi:predicted ribosomally synthesized peptide with nif11-like leader
MNQQNRKQNPQSENAQKFIKKVTSDPNLKKQALNYYKEIQRNKSEIEKLAKEAGCPCTFAEIANALMHAPSELKDEELLKISGGKRSAAGGAGPAGGPFIGSTWCE